MTGRSLTVSLGDLVDLAHGQASRLMRDPEMSSMLATWVVQRVLGRKANHRAAAELVRLAAEPSRPASVGR